MMIGEKRWRKMSAVGSMEPEPLTITRRLYAARPRRRRILRYFSEPGPRVTELRSTVRAPDITASAWVRSSIMCCLSRLEPKFGMAPLALAILPSADMPRLRKRKGRLRFGFGFTGVLTTANARELTQMMADAKQIS